MSWDLTAIKTKRHIQSVSDLTEEDCAPLERQQMIAELEKAAKTCDAHLDTSDPSWLVMQKREWLIEFSLGKQPRERLITMGLRVRGSKEPTEVFAYLIQELGIRLVEWSTGEFLDLSKQSSFGHWQEWSERVLRDLVKSRKS
ncbi:MAG: hypothetical protein Q4B27_03030 [Candidatus Saccharibacteria bacterium]|nr:hypothetical protein [Candidatus Saccharibacteria bacterium]